jgi:hypothetical protein
MLPKACGLAPGATTVLRLISEFGRIQPLAGSWHEAQACALPGMAIGSKKIFFPSTSRGVSAAALAAQKKKGVATTAATIKDFVCKCIIMTTLLTLQR